MTTESTPEKCCGSSKRCCCKCLCLAALLIGLLGAGLTFFLFPPRYEAQAWLRAYSQVPYTVFQTSEGKDSYVNFLATQFATIKSPMLFKEVLNDPRLAKVEWIARAKDPVRELARQIQVHRKGKSEYFTISCRSPFPEDAKAVVDAVVEAYLTRYKNMAEQREYRLTTDLLQEKQTYENQIKMRQKQIRTLTKETAEAPPESEQAQDYAMSLSFLTKQLDRDNQVLDKLSERLATIQTETRSPGRIMLESPAQLPTEPCDNPLPLAILVGVVLFGLTLVGGCVWRKFNNAMCF